jgi:hypothetical protein
LRLPFRHIGVDWLEFKRVVRLAKMNFTAADAHRTMENAVRTDETLTALLKPKADVCSE